MATGSWIKPVWLLPCPLPLVTSSHSKPEAAQVQPQKTYMGSACATQSQMSPGHSAWEQLIMQPVHMGKGLTCSVDNRREGGARAVPSARQSLVTLTVPSELQPPPSCEIAGASQP